MQAFLKGTRDGPDGRLRLYFGPRFVLLSQRDIPACLHYAAAFTCLIAST